MMIEFLLLGFKDTQYQVEITRERERERERATRAYMFSTTTKHLLQGEI